MRSAAALVVAAVAAMLLQTTIFPSLPGLPVVPDLILVLAVYLGVAHQTIGGAAAALAWEKRLLGLTCDGHAARSRRLARGASGVPAPHGGRHRRRVRRLRAGRAPPVVPPGRTRCADALLLREEPHPAGARAGATGRRLRPQRRDSDRQPPLVRRRLRARGCVRAPPPGPDDPCRVPRRGGGGAPPGGTRSGRRPRARQGHVAPPGRHPAGGGAPGAEPAGPARPVLAVRPDT